MVRANRKDLGLGFWASVTTSEGVRFFCSEEPGVALDLAHRHAHDLGLRAIVA